MPYEISQPIGREEAIALLVRLRDDDKFREDVERGGEEARQALLGGGLEIAPESMPVAITLPPKEEVGHLLYAAEKATAPTASPFGFIVLFVVFAAMPMVPGTDGTG